MEEGSPPVNLHAVSPVVEQSYATPFPKAVFKSEERLKNLLLARIFHHFGLEADRPKCSGQIPRFSDWTREIPMVRVAAIGNQERRLARRCADGKDGEGDEKYG